MNIDVYVDGACKGNPGVGGWGVYMIKGEDSIKYYGGESDTTNNRMELTAAIKALEHIPDNFVVNVYTDSKYVIDGITKWIDGWVKKDFKNVKNVELWKQLHNTTIKMNITWNHVRGHTGVHGNEVADKLANIGTKDVMCEITNSDIYSFLNDSKYEPELILTHAPKGRRFVVGDVHGRFDLLKDALRGVNFDVDDELFLVGDLINRGAYSHKAYKWLTQSNVYSVMGNHEQSLIDRYDGKAHNKSMDFSWFDSLSKDEQKMLVNQLRKLPICITLEHSNKRTVIVHGCIPDNDFSKFRESLNNNDNTAIDLAIWCSNIKSSNQVVKDVDTVYVGHSIVNEVTTKGNYVYIDCGAYKNGSIILVEIPNVPQANIITEFTPVLKTECQWLVDLVDNSTDMVGDYHVMKNNELVTLVKLVDNTVLVCLWYKKDGDLIYINDSSILADINANK